MLLSVPGSILIAVLRRPSPNYDTLIGLLNNFVMGGARGQAEVNAIHALNSAVGSFTPGGSPPYLDEAALAEVFRAFLRNRNISVPETPAESSGVWPPPPNFSITPPDSRNEK